MHAHAKDLHCVLLSSMQVHGFKVVNMKIALHDTEPINIFKVPFDIQLDELQVTLDSSLDGVQNFVSSHEVIDETNSFDVKVQWNSNNFVLKLVKSQLIQANRSLATSLPECNEVLQWCSRVQSTGQQAVDLERTETIVANFDVDAGTSYKKHKSTDDAYTQFALLDATYKSLDARVVEYATQTPTVYGYETLMDTARCQTTSIDTNISQKLKPSIELASEALRCSLALAPTDTIHQHESLYMLHKCTDFEEEKKRAACIKVLQECRHGLTHALASWHKIKLGNKNNKEYTTTVMGVRYTRQLYNAMLACDSAIRMHLYAGLGIACSPIVAERHHQIYRFALHRSLRHQDHNHLLLKPAQELFLQTTFDKIAAALPTEVASSCKLHTLEARVVCAHYVLAGLHNQQKCKNTWTSGYRYATQFNYTYSKRNAVLLRAQYCIARDVCMHIDASNARKHAALWLQRIVQLECEHKHLHRQVMKTCLEQVHHALKSDNTTVTDAALNKIHQLFSPAVRPLSAFVLFGQQQPAVFAFMKNMDNKEFKLFDAEAKAKLTIDLLCRQHEAMP